jgi:transposase
LLSQCSPQEKQGDGERYEAESRGFRDDGWVRELSLFLPLIGRDRSMPQLHLPMFPTGVTHITSELAFEKKDGCITYFNGHMPVFTHGEKDVATFRMITSQFCVSGYARQSDIIRAFGVTSISVKRSVKLYREKGTRGFYAPRVTRGAAVLVDSVVAQIEELLAAGASEAEVAKKLELKLNTLQKAIRAGRIRMPAKKKSPLDRR